MCVSSIFYFDDFTKFLILNNTFNLKNFNKKGVYLWQLEKEMLNGREI
jgi:hypothetical protein